MAIILKDGSAAAQVLVLLRKNKEMPVYAITSSIDKKYKAVLSALNIYAEEGENQLWHISGYTTSPHNHIPCRVYKIGKGANQTCENRVDVTPIKKRLAAIKIRPVTTLFQLLEVMNEAHQNQQQCSA